MVRYLYIVFLLIQSTMQGVKIVMQDMQVLRKSTNAKGIRSSASLVECYVCGKGLQDGHSITARTLQNGTVLFCDVHYLMQ